MTIRVLTQTEQKKPVADGDSVFQNAQYFYQMGCRAGKDTRQFPETKYAAIQQAKFEFYHRKLVKHEKAFIDGYVSSLRGGYFTENEHIGDV